jgi:hypothetical protein
MLRITLVRAPDLPDMPPHLAGLPDMCVALVSALGARADLRARAGGRATEIDVVLCGARSCRRWDVGADALGFHALSTRKRRDRRTGEAYFDINDRHQVFVNLATAPALLPDPADGGFRHDLAAWLVTVPHEVLHALEWIEETGGLTADELFLANPDEEWPIPMARALRAIEARTGGHEDKVEREARRIVDEEFCGLPPVGPGAPSTRK